MKIVFSKNYTVKDHGHVFRSDKFEEALKTLLREKIISRGDIVEAPEPSLEDLRLAHSAAWADKNLSFGFTAKDSALAELEITPEVVLAHLMSVGGTIKAAETALSVGLGVNCGGGAHHAFADHGEGFCVLNDVAIAIQALRAQKRAARFLIVDLDVHQGNGTAAIFARDPDVYTLSLHGVHNYPARKESSTLDIPLEDGLGDSGYLQALEGALGTALQGARADLVFYLAGVDVVAGDRYGRLALSVEGLRARERLVVGAVRSSGCPLVITLAGGYAGTPLATAELH